MRKAPLVFVAALFGLYVSSHAMTEIGWKILCFGCNLLACIGVVVALTLPRLAGKRSRFSELAENNRYAGELLVVVSILLVLASFLILYKVA